MLDCNIIGFVTEMFSNVLQIHQYTVHFDVCKDSARILLYVKVVNMSKISTDGNVAIIPTFSVTPVTASLHHLKIKGVYLAYFRVLFGDQDIDWAPHQACASYVETLRFWSQGKNAKLKFWCGNNVKRTEKLRTELLLLPCKRQRIY